MQTNKLRLALKANAIFSFTSGLSLLVLNQPAARVMNIPNNDILVFLGIGLVLFGLSVYWNAGQKNMSNKKIKIIVWQDWAWVIGSAGIIITHSFGISKIGLLIIGLVALIVAVFAILQQNYLKKTAK